MNERSVGFLRSGLLLAALLFGHSASAQPVGKWIATGSGDWGNVANWDSQPLIPFGPTAEAQFLNSITGNAVVTINTPIQLRKLLFQNTNGRSYTLNLANGQSFKFTGAAHSDGSSSNEIHVPSDNTGRHVINAPFEIANSDLTITKNGSAKLYINGGITEDGVARKLKLEGGPIEFGIEPNNHSGGTDIIGATVEISDNKSLGSVRAPLGLSSGGTLVVNNRRFFSMATRRIQLSGVGATIRHHRSAAPLVLESEISGDGNLTFLGGGGIATSVVLRGENTFTGNVTVGDTRSTDLAIDSDKALGNAANRLILKGGAEVKLFAENNITSTRPIDFEINRPTGSTSTETYAFTVNTKRFTVDLGGEISGTGTRLAGMWKVGTGKLILSGTATIQGGVFVDGGVLQVNGRLNPSGVIYVDGRRQKIGGTGIITGETFVSNGAAAAPGNSPGTLHSIGDVVLEGGSLFDFEINAATGLAGGTLGWDLWDVDGLLDLTQNLADRIVVRLFSRNTADEPGAVSDFDPMQPYVWRFFTATDGILGYSPGRFAINTKRFVNRPRGRFSVQQIDNSVAVVYTPVPEPASIMLLACGLGMTSCVRRRFLDVDSASRRR